MMQDAFWAAVGWASLWSYAGFCAYVLVIGVYRAWLAGRLNLWRNPVAFFLSLPILAVGLAIDLLVQYTIAALIFWDLPRRGEIFVTDRLTRYSAGFSGWRSAVAQWLCDHILDIFDPKGDHC